MDKYVSLKSTEKCKNVCSDMTMSVDIILTSTPYQLRTSNVYYFEIIKIKAKVLEFFGYFNEPV